MDRTCITVKGECKYFYRAVDRDGNTLDFLFTDRRDTKAALCFFKNAIDHNGNLGLIAADKFVAITPAYKLTPYLQGDRAKKIKVLKTREKAKKQP